MSESASFHYFDGLYSHDPDPWRIGEGWYELRKRNLVLAALPAPRYRSAFEPGCANGDLTLGLVGRCDRLLAVDLYPAALDRARARLGPHANAELAVRTLPEQWPADRSFDLIVISEIGYFLSPSDWSLMCRLAAASLEPDGTVVACHWRRPFDQRRLPTDDLHDALTTSMRRQPDTRIDERDFLLDVWHRRAAGD